MIVIDIAQRAAARAYDFHPGYGRRNDADRRPARRVVMPNDGPAPDREARAAAILQRIEAPKPWMLTDEERAAAIRLPAPDVVEARQRMVRYLAAVRDGAKTNAEVSRAIGEKVDRIRHVGVRAAERGLLIRGPVQTVGRLAIAPLEITDAGRAWLEANR